MRLFIAINFTDEEKESLNKMITELKKESKKGNFSRKENLHITLAFLGEVSPNRVKEIAKIMDSMKVHSFILNLEGFGNFKSRGEHLYWYGIKENNELNTLHELLISNLKQSGFAVDDKPFKPHITLVRRCIMNEHFSQVEFAHKTYPITVPIQAISLMKSETLNGKLTYTQIYETKLEMNGE